MQETCTGPASTCSVATGPKHPHGPLAGGPWWRHMPPLPGMYLQRHCACLHHSYPGTMRPLHMPLPCPPPQCTPPPSHNGKRLHHRCMHLHRATTPVPCHGASVHLPIPMFFFELQRVMRAPDGGPARHGPWPPLWGCKLMRLTAKGRESLRPQNTTPPEHYAPGALCHSEHHALGPECGHGGTWTAPAPPSKC